MREEIQSPFMEPAPNPGPAARKTLLVIFAILAILILCGVLLHWGEEVLVPLQATWEFVTRFARPATK